MKRKKSILLKLVTIVLIVLSIMPFVLAQNFERGFAPLFELFDFIFNSLSTEIVFIKFLIWMAFHSLLMSVLRNKNFLGGRFSDTANKRRASVISLVISLIGVIGIPNPAIVFLVQEFSFIFFMILALGVPAALFFTADKENKSTRGILLIVMAILLFILSGAISNDWGWFGGGSVFEEILWLVDTAGGIMFFAGIFTLLSGIDGENVADKVGNIANKLRGGERQGGADTQTEPTTDTEKKIERNFEKLQKLLDKSKVDIKNLFSLDEEEARLLETRMNALQPTFNGLQAAFQHGEKRKVYELTNGITRNLSNLKKTLTRFIKNTRKGIRNLQKWTQREVKLSEQLSNELNALKLNAPQDPNAQQLSQLGQKLTNALGQVVALENRLRGEINNIIQSWKTVEHDIDDELAEIQRVTNAWIKNKTSENYDPSGLLDNLKKLIEDQSNLLQRFKNEYKILQELQLSFSELHKTVQEAEKLIPR